MSSEVRQAAGNYAAPPFFAVVQLTMSWTAPVAAHKDCAAPVMM